MVLYAGPQVAWETEQEEIRVGVRGVDPGAYGFQGLGEFDTPPPQAKSPLDMTGEEFGNHLVSVMLLLDFFGRRIPAYLGDIDTLCKTEGCADPVSRQMRAACTDQPMMCIGLNWQSAECAICADPDHGDILNELQGTNEVLQRVLHDTGLFLGPEWMSIANGKDYAALAKIMAARDPAKVQLWYKWMIYAIDRAQKSTETYFQIRESANAQDLAFFGAFVAVWQMASQLVSLPLAGLVTLIQKLIDAFAQAVQDIAQSVGKGLWKIALAIAIPVAVIGGGYVTYRVAQSRRRRRAGAPTRAPSRTPLPATGGT